MPALNEGLRKPLGRKAYHSIAHLPGSRLGPGDHSVPDGQEVICTTDAQDDNRRVIVLEKLDGSCVCVARIGGVLHPLNRAGWPCVSSPYDQHRMFHDWAMLNAGRFFEVLRDGERLCGEWIEQAHGTLYDLGGLDPFVPFDIMRPGEHIDERATWGEFQGRMHGLFTTPFMPFIKPTPVGVALAAIQQENRHGALDSVEGVVYRVERLFRGKWEVEFLAKYVRPDKVDGCYLEPVTGGSPVWNYVLESWKGKV